MRSWSPSTSFDFSLCPIWHFGSGIWLLEVSLLLLSRPKGWQISMADRCSVVLKWWVLMVSMTASPGSCLSFSVIPYTTMLERLAYWSLCTAWILASFFETLLGSSLATRFWSSSFSNLRSWISPSISFSSADTLASSSWSISTFCCLRRRTSSLSSICSKESMSIWSGLVMAGYIIGATDLQTGMLDAQTDNWRGNVSSLALRSKLLSLSVRGLCCLRRLGSNIDVSDKEFGSFSA